ncbi:MAG: hypothetical protein JWQ40_902 [Segetibacter sp.]|nr:hypothetical protein [Segetibacter sp.]
MMPLACTIAVVTFAACGGSSTTEETTADSLSSVSSTTESTNAASDTSATGSASMKSSYVDLYSGSTVKLEKDEKTGYYLNAETHTPVEYYIDQSTNDTFDRSGRVVNMALIKGSEGKYTVNESKVKIQGDGDLKVKTADGGAKVKIETDGDAKYKDDSVKIKVRDGKVKVKDRN